MCLSYVLNENCRVCCTHDLSVCVSLFSLHNPNVSRIPHIVHYNVVLAVWAALKQTDGQTN